MAMMKVILMVELYPAAAFEAVCSCVFRTFGAVYLFVMTMMTVMITTPALLMAYVCESAYVMHPSDLICICLDVL